MNKIWKFTLQAADPEALSSLTVTVNGQELPETGVLAGPFLFCNEDLLWTPGLEYIRVTWVLL